MPSPHPNDQTIDAIKEEIGKIMLLLGKQRDGIGKIEKLLKIVILIGEGIPQKIKRIAESTTRKKAIIYIDDIKNDLKVQKNVMKNSAEISWAKR